MNCITVIDFMDFTIVDENTWRFLEVLGIWIAGIATFSAVFVSLYLARHSRAPKLNLIARMLPNLYGTGVGIGCKIDLTNTGFSPISVVSCNLRLGRRINKIIVFTVGDLQGFPIRMDLGEHHTFDILYVSGGHQYIEDFSEILIEVENFFLPIWLILRIARIEISTASGHRFSVKLPKGFKNDLATHLATYRKRKKLY